MILTKCVFCGKKHIEYGNRTSYEITTLAQKSSYEMLIMILKDMKIFIKENECDQSLREAISCFCKYSLLICEEEVENKKNGFTDFHGVIFNGIIKLTKDLGNYSLVTEFIDEVCHKLWQEHEELLSRINIEQSEKFKNAC